MQSPVRKFEDVYDPEEISAATEAEWLKYKKSYERKQLTDALWLLFVGAILGGAFVAVAMEVWKVTL